LEKYPRERGQTRRECGGIRSDDAHFIQPRRGAARARGISLTTASAECSEMKFTVTDTADTQLSIRCYACTRARARAREYRRGIATAFPARVAPSTAAIPRRLSAERAGFVRARATSVAQTRE